MSKYRDLWDGLISAIIAELIKIENMPKKTTEDLWISGTLKQVLSKMCELHRLPPKMQKSQLTRKLFE